MAMTQTALAALVSAVVLVGGAQPSGQPATPSPRYDPAAEVTFAGTVTEVMFPAEGEMRGRAQGSPGGRGGRGPGAQQTTGLHLTVDTGDAFAEVRLGPSAFVDGEGFAFATGDEVEVTGARIPGEGDDAPDVILAREIRLEDRTLVLRDESGRPRWARSPR